MAAELQKTEEMRGMSSPNVFSAKQLQDLYAYQNYLSNNLKVANNNTNLYRYQRLQDYTTDDIRYDEIPSDFGSSKYDYKVPDVAMIYNGLTDWRAKNQGAGLEMLASLGQFSTRFAGTVLEGLTLLPGMLVGGIKHAIDYIQNDPGRPEEEKHNLVYDIVFNPISNAINKAQDDFIEQMPFYKTQEELDNSWWTNVIHHPFTWLAADVVPSMGFTAGAMVGGKLQGMKSEAILEKLFNKKKVVNAAADLGIALEEIPDEKIPQLIEDLKKAKAADKLAIIDKYLKNERVKNSISNWAGILNASATEANVEGYNTRKEYIDGVLPKAYEYMKTDYFQKQLHDNFNNDNEGFANFDDYKKAKEREVIQNIVGTADTIGLTTWGANLAFLSAHNKFFWDSFFNPKFLLKNSVRDYTKLFKVKSANGLIEDVTLKNSFLRQHPTLGKAVFIAKNGLAEAFEEMEQARFAESSKELYGSKMNELFFNDFNSLLDDRYAPNNIGLMEAAKKGLDATYLNSERWEEGVIGFLTGLIGLPRIGVHSSGNRKGKKGLTGWNFGGLDEWQAREEKYRQAEEMLKNFRTKEGNDNDSMKAIKEYLISGDSKEMSNLNIIGKSPLDMLRTGVMLNAIRSMSAQDDVESVNKNDLTKLFEWKSKVMSGILMGYDTYIQMGISKYFDNWLNYLQNINKQSDDKKEEFINELLNSGIFDKIHTSDGKSIALKNYSERNKQKLLDNVAENAKQIKKLLDLYSDVEAEAFDVFYNNFKGLPNSYMKIKSLLIGLTKAKAYEQFIEEYPVPYLPNKQAYYNLDGFRELYNALGDHDIEKRIEAHKKLIDTYENMLKEDNTISDTNKANTLEMFAQYVYDIIMSDRLQEYIYSITNPKAFEKEAEKAAKKTEAANEKREENDFKSKMKKALSDNSSMDNDSDIVNALIEASSPNGEFNPKLLDNVPSSWEERKKYFGLDSKYKGDDAKARRFNRLLNEINSYRNLISSDMLKIMSSTLTEQEKAQLELIVDRLREGGALSNIHQKYNDLFNEYFALSVLKEAGDQFSPEQQARYNVLSQFQLIQDINKLFENYTEEDRKAAKNVEEGAYQYFTYTKWGKNKTTSEKVNTGKNNNDNAKPQDINTNNNYKLLLSISKKICDIINSRSGDFNTDPFNISNLLRCMLYVDVNKNNYTISYETKNPIEDESDSITMYFDKSDEFVVKSLKTDKEFKIKTNSLNEFDNLTDENGFSVFSKPSSDTYSVGLALINPELLSPDNIDKLVAVSPEVTSKKLPDNIKMQLAQVYNEYKFLKNSASKGNQQTGQQPQQVSEQKSPSKSVYDSEGNIVPNISLSENAAKLVDAYNENNIQEINKTIIDIFKDTETGNRILNSVLKDENGVRNISLSDGPSSDALKSGLFVFSVGAYIPNVRYENKMWDIEVTGVDNTGRITAIKPVTSVQPDAEYILEFNNGTFNISTKKNTNYTPTPLKKGEGYQFPVTQNDYETKDENGNTVLKKVKSTEETDKSIKGTPLFKYIRDSILTPSGAYFSMVEQLPNGNYKYNVGDSVYFDYMDENITDESARKELDDFYSNYPNLKQKGKLVGIYSSNDPNTRELLGIVDPMAKDMLQIINDNANTLDELNYQINRLVFGNSSVLVEPDRKKNSLDKIDPNDECMYVFNKDGILYSNKSSNNKNTISASELETLVPGFEAESMAKDRIYIFSPSRSLDEKQRYSMAHTSVELVGLRKNNTNDDPQETPPSIKEALYEFAENWLNTATLSKEEYQTIDNLFYSTINNFHIFEDKDGALKIHTAVRDGDDERNQKVTEINTNDAYSIVNGILQVALDNDLTFPYKPDELFSDNNKWFNELKPYLLTTKAYAGESNIYFVYGPKDMSEQNTEPIKDNPNYTKPKEDATLTEQGTRSVDNNKSKDIDTKLKSIANEVLGSDDLDIESLKNDIISTGQFSSDNKQELSDSGYNTDSISELEERFKEVLPKQDNEQIKPCIENIKANNK